MLERIKALARRWTSERYQSTTVGTLSGQPAPRPYVTSAGLNAFSSWIAAAADMNAKAIASNPIRLYVREPSGAAKAMWPTRSVRKSRAAFVRGDARRAPSRSVVRKAASWGDDFVEVTDHPVLDLLHKVNPFACGFETLHTTALHMQLVGNAYWFTPIGAYDVPQEVWLMPPDRMWVIPDREAFVGGYEYRPKASGEITQFSADEVTHFRMPNPRSPWYGMGYVERTWCAVQQVDESGQMDLALYRNRARPDYAIIIKNAAANADVLDRYTERVNSAIKGSGKSGKPWTMTGDVDLRPLSFPPKDMSGREEMIEEIAAGFGVPVSLLLANDPNLASAEVGYASWREQTIAPLCKLIEEVLNQSLLPRFDVGEDAVLAFDDPVPRNEERTSVVLDRYVRAGIKTLNDAREELGEEPYEDELADAPLVNGQPLGHSPQPVVPPQMPQRREPEQERRADDAPTKAINEEYIINEIMARMRVAPIASVARKACCGAVASQKALNLKSDGLGDYDDTERDDESEAIIRRYIAGLDETLRDQAKAVVDRLRASGITGPALVDEAMAEIRSETWVERIAAVSDQMLRAQLSRSGAAASDALGVGASFDAVNPEVQRWVNTATTRLANGVNETTEVAVSSLLGDAMNRGATIDEMATMIEESTGSTRARSEMIARTESARAYSQGQIEAWRQSGVVAGKTWLLAPDACEFCRAMSRQYGSSPIPLDMPFRAMGERLEGVSGGSLSIDYADVDGPPLHPGCRCAVSSVLRATP